MEECVLHTAGDEESGEHEVEVHHRDHEREDVTSQRSDVRVRPR